MNKKNIFLCFFFLFLSLFLLAEEPLKFDLKPFFSKKAWPIVSKGFADDSVILENEIFVKTPPSLKIDCSRSKERIVSVSFYLIRKDFEMFRGKTVSFQAKIKRIAGNEKPYIQVRFRNLDEKGNYQMLFAKSQPIEISNSDWTDIIFTCDIPSEEKVNALDFQIYVNNTSTPTILIIDECSIVEVIPKSKERTIQTDNKFFFTHIPNRISRHLRL